MGIPDLPVALLFSALHLSSDDLLRLKKQIKDLLGKGFIEPLQASFAAPVLLLPKPGGDGVRSVIGYKASNEISFKDEYPFPRIQDLFHKLSRAKCFSEIDSQRGYLSVLLLWPLTVGKYAVIEN